MNFISNENKVYWSVRFEKSTMEMTFVASLEAHLQMIKPSASIWLSRMLQNMQCSRLDNKHITICFLCLLFSGLLLIVASRRIDCKTTYCLYASLTSLLHFCCCKFKVQAPPHMHMQKWVSFYLLNTIVHESCILIVCFREFWCFNLLDAIVEPFKLFPTLRRYLLPRGKI